MDVRKYFQNLLRGFATGFRTVVQTRFSKQELDRQKEEQRRMLYTSDMNLVQSAWEADNVNRVIEQLNAHRPQPGQLDLRGFEWHYWNRQCHSNLRTVKLKKGSTYTPAVFSPDGKRLVGTRQTSSSSADAPIVVWDTETGAELQALESLEGQFLTAALAWHPDGQHVAIASFDVSDTSIAQVEVVPLDSASQYYTRLLEFAPQSHDVHNHLGIASRATGRYDKAIEHYSAAIGLKPGESVYHHNRGLVWHADNRDFDKALADYDEALSLSPSSADSCESTRNGFHNKAWGRRFAAHPRSRNWN